MWWWCQKISIVDRQIYRYIWSRTCKNPAKGTKSKQQATLPNLRSPHLMADSAPCHHKGISSSLSRSQKNCSKWWAGKNIVSFHLQLRHCFLSSTPAVVGLFGQLVILWTSICLGSWKQERRNKTWFNAGHQCLQEQQATNCLRA